VAKITVNRLSPGGEMTAEVVFDGPLEAIFDLNGTGIDRNGLGDENLETRWARFRVPVHIPWVDSKFFFENRQYNADTLGATSVLDTTETDRFRPLMKSFTLPPLQEWFNVGPDGDSNSYWPGWNDHLENTPPIVLDSVMFGFDQGDAPAARMSQWYGLEDIAVVGGHVGFYSNPSGGPPQLHRHLMPNYYEGAANAARLEAYEVWLGVYEKEQLYFDTEQLTQPAKSEPSRLVWQAELPHTTWAMPPAANPLLLPAAGVRLRPYRTYTVALDLPKLHSLTTFGDENDGRHAAMYSIWIWLNCRMPLVPRDFRPTLYAGQWFVQNEPAGFTDPGAAVLIGNEKPLANLVTTSPLSGGAPENIPMRANTATGDPNANTGFGDVMRRVDDEFEKGVRGGYSRDGLPRPFDHMLDDAAYDVLAIDLGQMGPRGVMHMEDILKSRHSGQFGTDGLYMFGFIAVPDEFVIHHVILALNFSTDFACTGGVGTGLGARPADVLGNVNFECGVVLATLGQGSQYNYQQVAYVDYVPSTRTATNLIDVVDWDMSGGSTVAAANIYSSATNTKWLDSRVWVNSLVDVPLVKPALPTALDGYGYATNPTNYVAPTTGMPFYVGKGRGDAGHRIHCGNGQQISGWTVNDENSRVEGGERFLEVRFRAEPNNNPPFVLGAGGAPEFSTLSHNRDDVLVGYGGHSVYIIGKRPLVTG
jgi:hypothetical protein